MTLYLTLLFLPLLPHVFFIMQVPTETSNFFDEVLRTVETTDIEAAAEVTSQSLPETRRIGGRQREPTPTSFRTVEEKKNWEKERCKKDSHNQSECRAVLFVQNSNTLIPQPPPPPRPYSHIYGYSYILTTTHRHSSSFCKSHTFNYNYTCTCI